MQHDYRNGCFGALVPGRFAETKTHLQPLVHLNWDWAAHAALNYDWPPDRLPNITNCRAGRNERCVDCARVPAKDALSYQVGVLPWQYTGQLMACPLLEENEMSDLALELSVALKTRSVGAQLLLCSGLGSLEMTDRMIWIDEDSSAGFAGTSSALEDL